jgi:parvulin-like peptidyl-prolyl isomerase
MKFKKAFVLGLLSFFVFGVVGCTLFAKVAANVDGEKIYVSDVDKELDRIAAQHQTPDQKKAFEQQKKRVQRQVVEIFIDQALYRKEAERLKIKVTDKEVEAQVEQTKKRFPTEAEFSQALKSANLTMNDLRDLIRNRLITERVNKKVIGPIKVTDEEMRSYYEANKDQFKQPEQVKVSHILVKTEAEAKDLLAKIKGGEDFAKLAKEKSTDPTTKDKGGDLGFVQRGGIFGAEFDQLAFSLPAGEVGGPIQTQFGWEIVKAFEKKPEVQRTFEESKADTEKILKNQKESTKAREWLEKVRKKARIKIFI